MKKIKKIKASLAPQVTVPEEVTATSTQASRIRPQQLMTPRQLADAIGVHTATIRRWRKEGRLTTDAFIKIGPDCYRYLWGRVLRDLNCDGDS
jgi:hypothetical protein